MLLRSPLRSLLLVCCILAIAGASYVALRGSAGPSLRRPNFIVILTDDQRHDTLATMPVLTRLAEEGLRFENSFVTSPVCGPSRASLLSGRLAKAQGVFANESASTDFDASTSIAVKLQDAGYTTALYGKYLNGYRDQFPAVPPGWDEWRVFRDAVFDLFGSGSLYHDALMSIDGEIERPVGYTTDRLADFAVDFIDRHAEEPFFLHVSFWGSHVPLLPAPRHVGTMSGAVPEQPPSLAEADLDDKPIVPIVVRSGDTDEQQFRDFWDSTWPKYLEVLLSVDEALERILDKLDEEGLAEDTVVIFTSDNGFLFGEHWWLGKGVPYEEAIRVPMVLRYPARVAPRRSQALVANIDIAPTLAELAGTEIAADGRSLVELFESEPARHRDRIERGDLGAAPAWRQAVPIEWFMRSIDLGYVGLRFQNSKLVIWDDGSVEVYDLERDPHELENRRTPTL